MKHARMNLFILFLITNAGCLGSSTTPKSAALTNAPVVFPAAMVFSAEAAVEPASAQLRKLLQRLETAQKWRRPLLLRTVFSRLQIPLPEACARWGHVQVIVPETGDGDKDGPRAPVTQFLFVIRDLSSDPVVPDAEPAGSDEEAVVSDGEPVGPDAEPENKKGPVAEDAPIAVHTCAVLLTPGTNAGRVRIGVVPLLASRSAPHVVRITAVESYSLIHLALPGESDPGHVHPIDGAEWSPDQILLFFGRGTVAAVGEWPGTAPKLPDDWTGFTARLRVSLAFGRLVLVLEQPPDDDEDGDDEADAADAAPSDGRVTRCAWIDATGRLSAISGAELRVLSAEAGFSACAPSVTDADSGDAVNERDLP